MHAFNTNDHYKTSIKQCCACLFNWFWVDLGLWVQQGMTNKTKKQKKRRNKSILPGFCEEKLRTHQSNLNQNFQSVFWKTRFLFLWAKNLFTLLLIIVWVLFCLVFFFLLYKLFNLVVTLEFWFYSADILYTI